MRYLLKLEYLLHKTFKRTSNECSNQIIKHIKNKKGTVYNIGSGYATSINDIANMMLKISQKNLQIIKNPGMKGDISHSLPSIDLAKNELGYVPKVKLEKGLEDLLSN